MLDLEGQVGVVAEGMIADLIVVDGDPVKDIRVLQDRAKITAVVKDGRHIIFDEEALRRRWPHERGQAYSVIDLTYDMVHGDGSSGPRRTDQDSTTYTPSDAADLVSDLRHREASSRQG